MQILKRKINLSKRTLLIILFIVLLLLSIILLSKPPYEKVLAKTKHSINKTCPFWTDKYIRLDSVSTKEVNEFEYFSTLINRESGEWNIDSFREESKPIYQKFVKTNSDLEYFRKHGIKLIYHFKDEKSNPLFDLNYEPSDYN